MLFEMQTFEQDAKLKPIFTPSIFLGKTPITLGFQLLQKSSYWVFIMLNLIKLLHDATVVTFQY